MNKILTNKDIKEYEKFYSLLLQKSESAWKNNKDALLKWSSILDSIEKINISPKSIVEFGCGQSNLTQAIDALFGNLLERVHLFDVLPREKVSLLDERFNYTSGDMIEVSSEIPDESIDIAIDACSITHVKTSSNDAANDGILAMAKILRRILKPDGYFISSSDILSFHSEGYSGEFISAYDMIRIYESQGLKLTSNFDHLYDDAFLLGSPDHGYGKQLAIGCFVFTKENL